jgi:predicted nucleic-acid-binding protein
MIAVDTNVLLRFLINDSEAQHQKAFRLFSEHAVYILKTVLLETEWVLRGSFELSHTVISEAFQKLLLQKGVHIEDRFAVMKAMTLYDQGMDFADALHLASLPDHYTFVSFDKKLIKIAKQVHLSALEL